MDINSSKTVQLNRGMSWSVSPYPSSLPRNMLGKVYTMFYLLGHACLKEWQDFSSL